MSKPASKEQPKRRHSIAVIAPSSTKTTISTSPTPPAAAKQDSQRSLSIPNGNFNNERRRGSLVPIVESGERVSSGGLSAVPAASNTRRRSVVVVSPPLDEKPSTSRRSSMTRRPSISSEDVSADQLISEFVRQVDEEAMLGNRRDSLPQASNEFASVMNEMANISITVNIAS